MMKPMQTEPDDALYPGKLLAPRTKPARSGEEIVPLQRMARPLRKSVCADYALHLEAAMQTGELSSGTDVRYLADLLANVLKDCKWPSDRVSGGGHRGGSNAD